MNHHFLYFTGAVFPMANALKYYDVGVDIPSLVQSRNGIFLEPDGNWGKEGRKYVVISSGTFLMGSSPTFHFAGLVLDCLRNAAPL